jgi:hypothetical protein
MALPLIPLAVGAGLLALLALSGKKSTAPAGGGAAPAPGAAPVPPTPAPPPTPGAQPMPPQLKAQFDDLLSNGVNADGLEQVAGELEKFGFMNEGATLRARAAQLRAAQAANAASQPPPFVPGVLDGRQTPAPAPAPSPPISVEFPADASLPGISVAPPPPPTPAKPSVVLAKVTTNDAPPSGDLIMRDQPSDSGTQVPGGGAEKDGVVQVITENADSAGIWSEIIWKGGSRRPAAQGFAKKKFLVKLPPQPSVSGIVVGAMGPRYAKCAAPSGCRLRIQPSVHSTFRAIVGNGETVQVLNHAQGEKADIGSPGPGGWARVKYKNLTGWVPSEWLAAA